MSTGHGAQYQLQNMHEKLQRGPESANRGRRGIVLALTGLAITAIVWLLAPQWIGRPQQGFGSQAGWVLLGTTAGFIFRVLRRRAVLWNSMSMHQAFSFEALLQGSTLLNPQLEYPAVEREFLMRETGLPKERLESWFAIRPASAVSIPLVLCGAVMSLASMQISALVCLGLAGAAIMIAAIRSAGIRRIHFSLALLSGIAAALAEGTAVVLAVYSTGWTGPEWRIFLLYGLVLTAFELSPVPAALGMLEIVYALLALITGPGLPGLIVPMLYRLLRGGPILLLTFFYLPRYKLAMRDLFDERLPLALALSRRPQDGWAKEAGDAGPLLSIVIPAYNEELRLPGYLPDVVAFAERSSTMTEVLVIDDGSQDKTAAYVEGMASKHAALRLLRQGANQGKGAAVRRGVMEAKGRYILFADADGATPIGEVTKMLPVAERGIEVVIASRKAGNEVKRSLLRGLMSATFYRLTNLLAVPAVADTQCGFKLFSRMAAQRIFPLVQEKGWAFDVEVLFLAQKLGFAIAEVPVVWTAIEGSKVSPLKDSLKMFVALWRIRGRAAGFFASHSGIAANDHQSCGR